MSSAIAVEPLDLPAWLSEAFAARGFASLTPIQTAVLQPSLRDRDLRIASATGSGKTVAVAIAIGDTLAQPTQPQSDSESAEASRNAGAPRALLLAPTRELAAQLRKELSSLYQSLRLRVALVVGGGAYRDELRSLGRKPDILVATPGRLLDHLQRGSVRLDQVQVVALDEADQLLELGFKDDLDAILAACPGERRTLLISATFNDGVRRLADTHQRDPRLVQGTPTHRPHADIEHVVHLIRGRDQLAAICNLLLAAVDDRSLVFVTTRSQVAEVTELLAARNFSVGGLSGELSQAERSRTLEAFREGRIRTLVATDVAARGIDVQDVKLVVHAFPPRDAEALIHRSGRTGRAGQRGRSVQLVTPADTGRLRRLFRSAGLDAQVKPLPSPDEIRAAHSQRLLSRLAESQHSPEEDELSLAAQLLQRFDAKELVARLLPNTQWSLPCEPATIAEPTPPPPVTRAPSSARQGSLLSDSAHAPQTFELSYGKRRGATPERVMAMICRRGRVRRSDVGHIEIGENTTRIEITAARASAFAKAAGRRDQRDRDIHIRPVGAATARVAPAASASRHATVRRDRRTRHRAMAG